MKRLLLFTGVLLFLSSLCGYAGCGKTEPNPEVSRLINMLKTGSNSEKKTAIRKLRIHGPEASPAIPYLLKELENPDLWLKMAAGNALVRIGPEAARAIVRKSQLSLEEQSVLSRIGKPALPFILKELKTTQDDVKQMSLLFALQLMGRKAESALPALEKMKKEKSDRLVEFTIQQIKEAEPVDSEAAAREREQEQWEDVFLDKLYKDEEALEEKRKRLQKKAVELAEEMLIKPHLTLDAPEADALIERFGDDLDAALPTLREMLDGELEDKGNAILCLGRMGKASNRNRKNAIPILRDSLKDEEIVRTLSAVMLMRLGKKDEAVPVFIDTVSNNLDPSSLTFAFALGGLVEGKIPVKDTAALNKLKELLSVKKPELVLIAALILINSDAHDDLIPPMTKMLKSSNPSSRWVAAVILWKMGPKARPAVAALKAAKRKETNPEIESIMIVTIMAMGKTEDDIDTLLAELKNPDKTFRLNASFKIRELDSASKRKILPSLLEMIETADKFTKDLLIMTISHFGKDAEDAHLELAYLLEESVREGNTNRQFHIISIMADIGKPESSTLIVKFMRSRDPSIRNIAMVSLGKLGKKAKPAVPELIKMTKEPELCEDALRILEKTGPLETEEQVASIAELMESSGMTASMAMFTLIDIGGVKAIQVLIKKLYSPKKDTRLLAVRALGEINKKSDDPRVVPALKSALKKEQDERVISEINSVLKELKNN